MKPLLLTLIPVLIAATTASTVRLPALVIPGGSDILVRADESIDSRTADEGRVYAATVDQNILDTAGNVAVHKGARAELLVREVEPKKELVLDCSRSS